MDLTEIDQPYEQDFARGQQALHAAGDVDCLDRHSTLSAAPCGGGIDKSVTERNMRGRNA